MPGFNDTKEYDALTDEAVARLRGLVAVPSISARGEKLVEGAEAFAEVLSAAGLHTEIWSAPGAPVVFAERDAAPGRPTVIFYGHYDVQPPEPLEDWVSPPFEATVRDGAVFGRGAGDNKGQLLAHVLAVQHLTAAGQLDCGVKFLIEGEEEVGSPHIAEVVRSRRGRLEADLAITSDAPVHDDGRPLIIYGVRGLLYVEIEARGAVQDLHSGNRGGIAPVPAWRLVRALASLHDPAGRVAIDGFYDRVEAPSAAEAQMMSQLPLDSRTLLDQMGIEQLPETAAADPWRALMFQPNLNLAGVAAGYSGPGAKTVIPARAIAKLDLRLVARQDPDDIFDALRRHLLDLDTKLEVRRVASVPPSSTAVDTPYAAVIAEAIERATGVEPWHRPRLGGTTPDHVFTSILGVPSLLVPYGPPDMSHHAPNERMTIAALRRGLACSIEICRGLGSASAQR